MRAKLAHSEDRAMGVLLGIAAGDRIGGAVGMALRVAESVRACGCVNVSDISLRYLEWWRKGAFDTGPTAAQVLMLVASGSGFEQAARKVHEEAHGMTAGCNPAHRSAPVAMCASIRDSAVGEAAATEAGLTHRHPLAGDVSAAVACLCRALIRGVPWSEAILLAAQGRMHETRCALGNPHLRSLSPSGFAPDALGAAIHFLNTSNSFQNALVQSLGFAGAPNYCPVLVGSIGGARWGWRQIQKTSLRHHGALVLRVEIVARALADGWRNAKK